MTDAEWLESIDPPVSLTEAEWLACNSVKPMLKFLRGRISDRKLRLIGVACCRRLWHLLMDERSKGAVEAVELLADGLIAAHQLGPEFVYLDQLIWVSKKARYEMPPTDVVNRIRALQAVSWCLQDCGRPPIDVSPTAANCRMAMADAGEDAIQVDLVRDVVGLTPFRPIMLERVWRSRTAVSIAESVYADRDFQRLPILADAFEDAGCTDQEVLMHCRQPGTHVRGCWVVDLALGKA